MEKRYLIEQQDYNTHQVSQVIKLAASANEAKLLTLQDQIQAHDKPTEVIGVYELSESGVKVSGNLLKAVTAE